MFVFGCKVEEFTSEAYSIPRLKLQAATSSVKIYSVLMDELTYEISKVTCTFWSDSQMTL